MKNVNNLKTQILRVHNSYRCCVGKTTEQQPKVNNSCLNLVFLCLGDTEQELGPPPSVDEAANTLMTRLGFLLGEKVTEVQPGPQYSMEVQDENQVWPLSP